MYQEKRIFLIPSDIASEISLLAKDLISEGSLLNNNFNCKADTSDWGVSEKITGK